MKKFVVAVATVFAVAAVVAGGVSAGSGGTVVAEGFACGVLDHNGNIFITYKSVLTRYQNRAVLQCVGDGAGGPGLIHWNFGNTGLSCGMLEFGSTTQWDDKVGYNGNSQLQCIQPLNDANGAASAGAGIG